MKFCTPREGNLGNVLLTRRNRPKYFYQCTTITVKMLFFELPFNCTQNTVLERLEATAFNSDSKLHLLTKGKNKLELCSFEHFWSCKKWLDWFNPAIFQPHLLHLEHEYDRYAILFMKIILIFVSRNWILFAKQIWIKGYNWRYLNTFSSL